MSLDFHHKHGTQNKVAYFLYEKFYIEKKNCHLRNLYPAKNPSGMQEISRNSQMKTIREFRCTLKEWLKIIKAVKK